MRSVAPLHDCMMNDLRGKRSQMVVVPMSASLVLKKNPARWKFRWSSDTYAFKLDTKTTRCLVHEFRYSFCRGKLTTKTITTAAAAADKIGCGRDRGFLMCAGLHEHVLAHVGPRQARARTGQGKARQPVLCFSCSLGWYERTGPTGHEYMSPIVVCTQTIHLGEGEK